MKRYIVGLLFLLCLVPAYGLMPSVLYQVGMESASCEVYRTVANEANTLNLGDSNANTYRGALVATGSHYVCEVYYYLTNAEGNISGITYYAVIADTSSNNMTLPVRATSAGVTGNNGWSATKVTFTFSPSVLVQAGDVIAIMPDTISDTNFAKVHYSKEPDSDAEYSQYGRWDNTGTNQALVADYDLTGDFYD